MRPRAFRTGLSNGFDDPEALKELLTKDKDLRIPVMHFQEFTHEHLRDMRATWKAIEAGLVHLTSDFEFEYH